MGLPVNEREAILFPEWNEALNASGLTFARKMEFAQEVFALLQFCKSRHAPISIMGIKIYLEQK